MQRTALALIRWASVSLVLGFVLIANAAAGGINVSEDGVAILGYDTVAYFTAGKPTKGSPRHAHTWRDAEWHFSSVENRDLFAADPEKYAPQFGGHCAMALTDDVIKVVDPEAWTITNGKLYLTFSQKGREKLRRDLPGNIAKSEANWTKRQDSN